MKLDTHRRPEVKLNDLFTQILIAEYRLRHLSYFPHAKALQIKQQRAHLERLQAEYDRRVNERKESE